MPGFAGTNTYKGYKAAYITANGTTQVLTGAGRLVRLIVSGAGSAWTVTIYDDTAGTSNQIWAYATADGKANVELDVPVTKGIKVVAAGTTAGQAVVVYS